MVMRSKFETASTHRRDALRKQPPKEPRARDEIGREFDLKESILARIDEIGREIDLIVNEREERERLEKAIASLRQFGSNELESILEMEREQKKLANRWPVLNERHILLIAEYHRLENEVEEKAS